VAFSQRLFYTLYSALCGDFDGSLHVGERCLRSQLPSQDASEMPFPLMFSLSKTSAICLIKCLPVNLSQDATKGPRETILYLPAIVADGSRPDYLATVDVEPGSNTFSQVNMGLILLPSDLP
jgi:hypothetical protein